MKVLNSLLALTVALCLCQPDFAERMTEPKLEKFQTEEGEVVIVRIPINQQIRSVTEFQTCIIWRDKTKQVLMQCPTDLNDKTERDPLPTTPRVR